MTMSVLLGPMAEDAPRAVRVRALSAGDLATPRETAAAIGLLLVTPRHTSSVARRRDGGWST